MIAVAFPALKTKGDLPQHSSDSFQVSSFYFRNRMATNYASLFGLFVAWYAFNAGYNVYNAYVKVFGFPLTIAAAQLGVGLVYFIPLWILGVRKLPKITFDDFLLLLPIALLNVGGHACAVIAMFEVGGGSFTHVIKASEPVVSVILGLVVNGIVPKPFTAISLLPITYGVAYASTLGQLDATTMSRELGTRAAR
jgi:drug/metabolite transporter (DMT)-like permease